MNAITTARQQLAQALDLGEGWRVHPDTPGAITAPAVLIGNATPYLEAPDALGGAWWLHASVWLLASSQTSAAARERLDQMLSAVLPLLQLQDGTSWCLDVDAGGVEAPVLLRVGSDTYTAARVPVAVQIDLTTEGA